MRSALQLNTQLLFSVCTYISLTDLSSLPLQVILVAAYLVCLGLHFELLFTASFKDRICTNIMAIDNKNGRPWACSTHLKYSFIGWVAMALQGVPTFVLMYSPSFWPTLWIFLIALGSVLSSAFEDMKENLDDVEERMHEALDAQEGLLGAPYEA
ncbi:Aste57867_4100 [Aphanomyces stellatus]|uniref:Aste57867_4100 protein n=1 Tax=Aphanomyces stellatus TaxID=120398 RepID=A0A485KGH7_9STRA|nr:hypothetical protein As57867_004089 [Aphanomyces stellatus]VFT81233.1 Aste57867_4100 [Aphanomyces stellatus]